MGKYLKKFETHAQYEAFTATTEFIKPNVSICIDTPSEVHYNPLRCEETSEYEVIGEPSYPSEIEGDATSFEMTVNYQRTDTNIYCQETVTEGTDTVTVEIGQNPSTSSTRTVTGTVDYYGNEIEYSVTQSKYVDYNGHEYVDLGLPSGTKWAKMNVGADSETAYGNYYMYGKGASQYNSSDSIYIGTEDPLAISADTAAQVMGGQWHVPTFTQFNELKANTTYEMVTIDGINGCKFTATNGNYVFFPAAGRWYLDAPAVIGSACMYWSSTPNRESNQAYYFLSNSDRTDMYNVFYNYGLSVRGVVG